MKTAQPKFTHSCRRVGWPAATLTLVLLTLLGCAGDTPKEAGAEPPAAEAITRGGRVVVALRAEPRTFNPVTATDRPSQTVLWRTMADLVHLNPETQEFEPALAESFEVASDDRLFQLKLRQDVLFSDGEPFDAEDVLFTFEALLDEAVASPHRDLLMAGGEPVQVRKIGPHDVEFEFAAPYAAGLRIFDSIAILPEHRLGAAYREGRLTEVWGSDTPPEVIAGLGPFRLARYVPGQELVLERNPHYWKTGNDGEPLPYLHELAFTFVGSEEAQVLRFQAGETHLVNDLDAESFQLLGGTGQGDAADRYILRDVGPGLDFTFLFFNLNDIDAAALPEVARRQQWFRRPAFRKAMSRAVDRESIVRLVYEGRATAIGSHISRSNKLWYLPELEPPPRSPEAARTLLADDGFSWDDGGTLHDPNGNPVTFTLVTNSSNAKRVRIVAILQEDLRQLGIEVAVATLEFRALLERVFTSYDYDACVFSLTGDIDPDNYTGVWRSGGGTHLWRMAGEADTDWQRELDQLMDQQVTAVDATKRRKIYNRVQRILAEQEPMVFLVSANVLVGAHPDLGNFRPTVLRHSTLWNVDELYWRGDLGGR